MKTERTKNAARNIFFGVIYRIYLIILPFVMRTALIYFMGMEYLGLTSLFTSILQILNLAELGVGSAMIYSMYKPIAEDDTDMICALMALYKKYYRIIGGIILVIGLILLPFIPHLVKVETVPEDVNVYVLYIMYLANTVLSYWLFAYKNCIINAHQRTDIITKICIIMTTVQYGTQFLSLYFIHNYYVYTLIIIATQIGINLITAVVAVKKYPKYVPKGQLDESVIKGINQRVKDLFTAKIGGAVVNSADTIVISAFLGLVYLAVYQNYFFVLSSVISIVGAVFTSCTAGIGNSIILESKEKNYSDFETLTLLICMLIGFCSTCFVCLFQPFIKLWVGAGNMLPFGMVVLFVIYFYCYEVNQLLCLYKDAAGIWHEDRWRTLITAGANLVMNLIMVQFWGLYGILLSTVLSTCFIGLPWLIHNLFTVIFKMPIKKYVYKLLKYTVVNIGIVITVGYIVYLLPFTGLTGLIIKGCVCVALSGILVLGIFSRFSKFNDVMMILNKLCKGKLDRFVH